jgi:antitoxin component YwqK of YwqJK toxin-antitoxin module
MTNMLIINADELYVLDDGTKEWHDKPFTGIAREYRSDGSTVSDTEYLNGLQEGVARSYHPSGTLYSEDHFVNDGFHGLSREWNESGQLVREALYEHGILVSEKKWDESGCLMEDFTLTENDRLFKTLQDYRKIYSKNFPK